MVILEIQDDVEMTESELYESLFILINAGNMVWYHKQFKLR